MANGKILSELDNPIIQESFAIIDREIGEHNLQPGEYAIARRVIHATADFEFADLLYFSPEVILRAIDCLRRQVPIITDVGMVKQGISTLVSKTFNNPIIVAVDQVKVALPGKTRTETGLLECYRQYPHGIYLIGNAPTALLALCQEVEKANIQPGLIIGAPVGFVKVLESKSALAKLATPQIRINGRKGGSGAASAILNALIMLAW